MKEYDGYKHEQRAEHVNEVRYIVKVILKYDFFCRSTVQFVYVLVEIKYHHNDDNQRNGKEVCTQELLYDVPVKPFE